MNKFLNELIDVTNNGRRYVKQEELPMDQWIDINIFRHIKTRHGQQLAAFTRHSIIFLPERVAELWAMVNDDESEALNLVFM